MRILFSDEKMFDIDNVYNVQNERVWGVHRITANTRERKIGKRKFPPEVMVWLEICSKGVTRWLFLTKDRSIMTGTLRRSY